MSDTTHTPLPWTYMPYGVRDEIIGSNDKTVCEWDRRGRSEPPNEADAEFMLRACNAHGGLVEERHELLAACRVCETTIIELLNAETPTSTDWLNIRVARNLALAAIAKAKP